MPVEAVGVGHWAVGGQPGRRAPACRVSSQAGGCCDPYMGREGWRPEEEVHTVTCRVQGDKVRALCVG